LVGANFLQAKPSRFYPYWTHKTTQGSSDLLETDKTKKK